MREPFGEVKHLVADRLKWRATIPVSVEVTEQPWGVDLLRDQVTYLVEAELLTREVRTEVRETLTIPTSWFQHLKSSVLPEWLKRRFPPRTISVPITIRHHHNCPHLDVPRNGSAHLHFLALGHE